jgi:outer membrane murein-binding lipoprotein Lpp
MVRLARWFTIGAASAVLLMAGCSSPNTSTSSTTQPSASTETAESKVDATADEAETSADAGAAKPTSRPVENVTLQPGTDPLAIVFAARQPNSEITGTELIKVAYPNPEKAIVTITKTGLMDDSIAATRTRYDFKPVEGSTEEAKQWQLVQVTEQNKCQPNRGSQDWTGDLCQ